MVFSFSKRERERDGSGLLKAKTKKKKERKCLNYSNRRRGEEKIMTSLAVIFLAFFLMNTHIHTERQTLTDLGRVSIFLKGRETERARTQALASYSFIIIII